MKRFVRWLTKLLEYPLRWQQAAATRPVAPGWGSLMIIAPLAALGTLVMAIACTRARVEAPGATALYWLALLLIFVPAAVRFAAGPIARGEAFITLIALSIALYLVSFLRSPLLLRGFDEFLHWRTAYDILTTGRLFTDNAMLPVSPLFPGLESVTVALVSLTGMNLMDAGALVLVSARIILLLSLFLLYERASGSAQVAAVGTLVYLGSSTFLYFDAQFGYESLALPLTILALCMLARREDQTAPHLPAWNALIAVVIFAIVLTHHVSTYMLIAFLVVWSATDIATRLMGVRGGHSPLGAALWALLLSAVWLGTVASLTLDYLKPILNDALNSFYQMVTGVSGPRRLFEDAAGQSAIILDRIVGIASVLVLGIALLLGCWWWLARHRRNALIGALMLVAVVYPLLPVMRLSGGAWEMANRLSGFVFVGLGLAAAFGLIDLPLPRRWLPRRRVAAVVALCIIFMGGVVAGASPDARLPQPFRAAASERSIDNEGAITAEWVRTRLGRDNRMAADRTFTNLMGSYGGQRMIVNLTDKISISGIFLSYELSPSHYRIIREQRIRYLLIDRRITTVLPTLGFYFEEWEQLIVPYRPPVHISPLEKFDYMSGVSRIFDSGDIVIYDVGGLWNAP